MEHDTTGADIHERTILAFKSALANLNGSIFDAEKVEMEELQPEKMMDVLPVETQFNVYTQVMYKDPGTTNANTTRCDSAILPFTVQNIPIGVQLNPIPGKNITYAVRLRTYVKPRGLIFAPGKGELELDAIAGAKPFGSRIGPINLNPHTEYRVQLNPAAINGDPPACGGIGASCFSPRIEIGAGKHFYSAEFINELFQIVGPSPTVSGLLKAERHATAPNPEEVGRFNILPPPLSTQNGTIDETQYEFIPYSHFNSDRDPQAEDPMIYRFYAPLFSGKEGLTLTKLQRDLQGLFPSQFAAPPAGMNQEYTDILAQAGAKVITGIDGYIRNSIHRGADSEYNETDTFAAIELPMANLSPSNSLKYWLTKGTEVRSSWGPDHEKISADKVKWRPRFGYSVKLVSMHDLLSQGVSTSDPDQENMTH
jgi:hypothetical protein